MNRTGLVLTAGGARAAYQAGVLRRLAEIPSLRDGAAPFPIIVGASAGAINAAALASGADRFLACTRALERMWAQLQARDVFRTDLPALALNSLRWIGDLSLGGLLGAGRATHLLDASPLRRLLAAHLDCGAIRGNVERGQVRALAVAATDYTSDRTVLFVQGEPEPTVWNQARRVAVAASITVDHLCASAAIPVIFDAVRLRTPLGTSWFGDGCLRLPAPLGPAIRLGADRILAIGVRHHAGPGERLAPVPNPRRPPLARVAGVALSSMFLDHLESDLEHLERVNRQVAGGGSGPEMRLVRALVVSPTVSLGEMAAEHFHHLPGQIRYLMRGLGGRQGPNADLVSYLLFTPSYTRALLEAGYRDADARRDEIEAFLRD